MVAWVKASLAGTVLGIVEGSSSRACCGSGLLEVNFKLGEPDP